METPSNQDRARSIFQMLFEMATGNFTFRVRRSEQNDELDELANVLNMVAAAMRQTIIDAGLIIPHYTYQSLVQTTFVLDDNFIIEGISPNVSVLLGYQPEMLFNIPFSDILSIHCTDHWCQISKEAESDKSYHNTIQLLFISANRQITPSFCTVSRLLYSNKIFISSVTTVLQNALADQVGAQVGHTEKTSDSQLIQDVHDYILNHLEEPLPTSKQLSKIFGTNEFKIKDGFRHFFNTSVYQFYNEERLKKAHLLIQQTNEPLKSIAFSCGYNDYMNFYKAFKKRFGYPPSDLQRDN
jgi:AraC-like DNA-binding protein